MKLPHSPSAGMLLGLAYCVFVFTGVPHGVLSATCPSGAREFKHTYTGVKLLDPVIGYRLHYKTDATHLYLGLVAQHKGYLAVGLAEQNSGHMKGSDIVSVYFKGTGEIKVFDRYVPFVGSNYPAALSGLFPTKDVHQDWTVEQGHQNSTHTVVELKRALKTGDDQDRDVIEGAQRVVWAWSTNDVEYHGAHRGSTTVQFIPVPGRADLDIPANDGSYTFKMDSYTIPAQKTTYACRSFTFPQTGSKHVIAIKPKLHPGTKEYPHHAILHICKKNTYFDNHASAQLCGGGGGGDTKGSSPLGDTSSECASLMWSWAVGMGPFILPDEAGFSVGDTSNEWDSSYVILEIHYDNPSGATGQVDESGFEVFYTNTKRTHEAGGMTLGDPLAQFSKQLGDLPKGKGVTIADNHREGVCPGTCTNDLTGPIQVFASFLHMHAFGRKMFTTQYDSGGNYLGTTSRVDFWDFEFQQMSTNINYTINRGDTLHTHCFFDMSKKTDADVKFGSGSEDEMCMDFIFYYPAQKRNNLRFAYCGYFPNDSDANAPYTLCGSLAQADNKVFLPNLQVAEVTNRRDEDKFTNNNKAIQAAVTGQKCTLEVPSSDSPAPAPAPGGAGGNSSPGPSLSPDSPSPSPLNPFAPTVTLKLNDKLTLQYRLSADPHKDNTVFTVTVAGLQTWMGFGVSPSGLMHNGGGSKSSDVHICSDGVVRRYSITKREMPSGGAIVPGATCSQTLTGSTMSFTRENNERTDDRQNNAMDIFTTKGTSTTFIFAYGSDIDLSYHGSTRGSRTIDMAAGTCDECLGGDSGDSPPSPSPKTSPSGGLFNLKGKSTGEKAAVIGGSAVVVMAILGMGAFAGMKCRGNSSNSQTKKTSIKNVASTELTQAACLAQADEWEAAVDPESGKTYYFNQATGKTSWELPSKAKETY